MPLNETFDRIPPNEDDVYGDVASALGGTLKQMIPRLCGKYGLERHTIVRATSRAALDVGVLLEADHIRLAKDDALGIANRVYEVMRDGMDAMPEFPQS